MSKVILEKNNLNPTYYKKKKFGKIRKRMSSTVNAIIFFHTLKTISYVGNDPHQLEDTPEHTAPYSARYIATIPE